MQYVNHHQCFTQPFVHILGFDPKSSPARNMALTTNISLGTKKYIYIFKDLLYTQSQKGNFFKNPMVEQLSFLQGCIVRPIKNVGQSLLRSV
jgi:hypothetical protein